MCDGDDSDSSIIDWGSASGAAEDAGGGKAWGLVLGAVVFGLGAYFADLGLWWIVGLSVVGAGLGGAFQFAVTKP